MRERGRALGSLLAHRCFVRCLLLVQRRVSLVQGTVKRQVALFSLHERIRGRTLGRTHMGVLVRDARVTDGVHPLSEGHAAAGRNEAVATLHGRGVAARVGLDVLVAIEGIILCGSVLKDRVLREVVLSEGRLGNGVIQREGNVQSFRSLRLISSFSCVGRVSLSRTGGLCELLILLAKDASRANRRHIKTGGRNQCQLGRNIQQLQHRLERQGVARIAQVRVQAAAGNGISLHAKHRHDISDALLDFVLIGTENL